MQQHRDAVRGSAFLTRRSFLARSAALGGGAAVASANALPLFALQETDHEPQDVQLRNLPARVFKSRDPGHEDTESWRFNLMVATPAPGAWRCEELALELKCGASVTVRTRHVGAGLAAIRTDLPAGASGNPLVHWPFTLRIQGFAPVSANIDAVTCTLRVIGPDEVPRSASIEIPFLPYVQRTLLKFPFVGHGLITQGGASDGGHGNQSGQFAVDAIGLTPMYAPQISDEEVNQGAAGWGRAILAPAAGVIAHVRTDRPDQPVPGRADPAYLLPMFKNGGDPGNHVVIDHENGEYSMIAHFQKDSVRVTVGQSVSTGDALGLLGNSGDSSFPHVHYQLMDGVEWRTCDALPYRFANMPERLVRGTWFNAKT